MPFIVKPIEEIKSIEIQPQIEKIENVEIDPVIGLYLILFVVVAYFFRGFILGITFFIVKITLLFIFAFLTYSLFFT